MLDGGYIGVVADEEDPYDDTWFIDRGITWAPDDDPVVEEESIITMDAVQQMPKASSITPSQFTEFAFWMPTHDKDNPGGQNGLGYDRFSFEGRRHMRTIYDTKADHILLCCARQVEKCCSVTTVCRGFDGTPAYAGQVRVDDWLATMSADGSHMAASRVAWVSHKYMKPCVRIRTRQGHEVDVALTHPMRTWDSWTEAGKVQVGDRLAVVRKCGGFYQRFAPERERICLTAYLIGDGWIGGTSPTEGISFTQLPGPVLDDFLLNLALVGGTAGVKPREGTDSMQVRLHKNQKIWGWMRQDLLLGTLSDSKFAPRWVWELSREDTALFLNRLWATDGHVKQNSRSKYSLEYCSISKRLIQDVQALLWKFGIPSCVRKNWPNYWKDQGTEQYAYILRIETQPGVRRFLSEIACLGKSENVPLPTSDENNNRDTFPIEINRLLRRIIASRGPIGRKGRGVNKNKSLRTAGLRETLKYPPTVKKLEQYLAFFKADQRHDANLVAELERHVETDLYWDVVEEIEQLDEQECVDFEVEGTHNFVADGFVTHNSTYLGNRALCYMSLVPSFLTLYVSPSATQSKVFSNDRVKTPISTSPLLSRFTTHMLSQNILEKQFINNSKITMRYAFLNADRARGIAAYLLELDEFQDILADNIPIIEQGLSHAPEEWRSFVYAGTPKSLDNNIEKHWSDRSTMCEWVVPHDCTGGDAGRYWNVLCEKNIGRKGLICSNCGALIEAMCDGAQWAAQTPLNPPKVTFEGYRISQLMVPWRRWQDILTDYENYPRAKFYNEVLGISYDSGMRPLTTHHLASMCNKDLSMAKVEQYRALSYGQPVYAGIDWGSGEHCYTVICLGTYVNMKFRAFFWHRFSGEETEPDVQLKRIVELCAYFNVKLIGADYGGGFAMNHHLIRKFGQQRLHQFQYVARSASKMKYDGKFGRFKAARTEVMSDIFNAIKRKQIEFPRWEEFHNPFAQDMLNIFSEYNETLRMIQYKHVHDKPDDSFHALVYCMLASHLMRPRPDIFVPRQEVNGQPVSLYKGTTDQGSE